MFIFNCLESKGLVVLHFKHDFEFIDINERHSVHRPILLSSFSKSLSLLLKKFLINETIQVITTIPTPLKIQFLFSTNHVIMDNDT